MRCTRENINTAITEALPQGFEFKPVNTDQPLPLQVCADKMTIRRDRAGRATGAGVEQVFIKIEVMRRGLPIKLILQ